MRIKICGITSSDDAHAVAQAGADAIGIVFYSDSQRNVANLALAREIALSVGAFVTVVGLFVNPAPAEVETVLSECPLHVLQFHGDETPDFCRQFRRPFIKAVRMKPGVDVEESAERFSLASGLLLDAYRPGERGGTGDTFEWNRIPKGLAGSIILAGGLSPSNVAQAVQQVRPYGLDVSTGVESAPGKKDPDKVSKFIAAARQANAGLNS